MNSCFSYYLRPVLCHRFGSGVHFQFFSSQTNHKSLRLGLSTVRNNLKSFNVVSQCRCFSSQHYKLTSHSTPSCHFNKTTRIRYYSVSTVNALSLSCQNLKHRSLIQITGIDSVAFLQGLITNDVTCFEKKSSPGVVYAFMLNLQGRVLYDIFIYNVTKSDSVPSFLLESDAQYTTEIIQALLKYKIRRKVEISLQSNIQVWSVWSDETSFEQLSDQLSLLILDNRVVTTAVPDPRLPNLGCRVLLQAGVECKTYIEGVRDCQDQKAYSKLLCRLGVGEGSIDFPRGACFPLEANAVFLHGVSFNKGCYIGQELTARSHHTGVIRKRLMPILFSRENQLAVSDQVLETASGKNCGKLRSCVGQYGLALLRVVEAVREGPLVVKDAEGNIVEKGVKVIVPFWWPKDTDEIIKQATASVEVVSGQT